MSIFPSLTFFSSSKINRRNTFKLWNQTFMAFKNSEMEILAFNSTKKNLFDTPLATICIYNWHEKFNLNYNYSREKQKIRKNAQTFREKRRWLSSGQNYSNLSFFGWFYF